MKIRSVVIFGATGNTGLATTEEAIKQGYEVTAFVRDKVKLGSIQPSRVIEGDVLKKDDVCKAVEGTDAVIIALGTRNDLSATTMLSDGTKNILAAMELNNVKRVSCCISSFLFWDRSKIPKPYLPITEDHERMLEALKASETEWIAVLPPQISDEPPTGKYVMKNNSPLGKVISKYDLAAILVECLASEAHVRHAVGIGYL